jgi:hypothetical protein
MYTLFWAEKKRAGGEAQGIGPVLPKKKKDLLHIFIFPFIQ